MKIKPNSILLLTYLHMSCRSLSPSRSPYICVLKRNFFIIDIASLILLQSSNELSSKRTLAITNGGACTDEEPLYVGHRAPARHRDDYRYMHMYMCASFLDHTPTLPSLPTHKISPCTLVDTCAAARPSGALVNAKMASVKGVTYCRHLSDTYSGWCFSTVGCAETCRREGLRNISGECGGFPSKCYCVTRCSP